MVTTLQIESIRRLLHGDSRISAVYFSGATQPTWKTVAQLASAGFHVTVVSVGQITPDARQFASLPGVSVAEVSEGMSGLEETSQYELLRDLLATDARPAAIATNDLGEDADIRRAKYELLARTNYHFAGMSGSHSMWTAAEQASEIVPAFVKELPPEIAGLPSKGPGTVLLDRVMAPPGEILHLRARAELAFSGWAMIAQDAPPAAQIFAVATHEETGTKEYIRLTPEPRTDVAAHFKTERLLMTGFRVDLSPLCHRIGVHSLTVLQTDGQYRYESELLFRFALQLQEYELTARAGLANRYLYGSGIEIGALQKPLRLSDACQVRYIDRMPLDKLLEHYPEMAQLPLQAPDIVDDGQQLDHVAEDSQDFAIANHFLEHCPNPVRSIYNMLRVVKQGGILYLAVPDKRYTFDLPRPVTPYSALKNAYRTGKRAGKAGLFYEWAHLVYKLPAKEAEARAEELIEEDYSIHYNVWTITGLLSFLLAAQQDFQIPFELVAAVSSENETIVVLERTSGKLPG